MSILKTRIYFCGGAGTNLGSLYGASFEGACFLDSSDANLGDKQITEDRTFLIPNTDGAGGNQAYMMPFARKYADDMLDMFEPGEMNILVCSADGGTGPAIATTLVGKLIEQDCTTVVVMVGGTDTPRRITNTLNTFKNLELRAAKFKRTVATAYVNNTAGEAQADQEALFILDALVNLSDQENGRLDTMDVHNWINYWKLCSVEPQLCTLFVTDNRKDAAAILEPISIASLYTDPTKDAPIGTAHVRTTGIVTNPAKMTSDQLHFVINTAGVASIMDDIEKERVKQNTTLSTYSRRKAIVTPDDDMGDNDYVAN